MYLRTINLYTKGYVEDTFTLAELDGMPDVSKLADKFEDTSVVLNNGNDSSARAIKDYDSQTETIDGYQVVIECPNK